MHSAMLLFSPYPTIHEGELNDGLFIKQPNYCHEKCKRECGNYSLIQGEDFSFYTCKRGFSVIVFKIEDDIIRVNGVIETSSNKATPQFKKDNKSRKLKLPELISWSKSLNATIPSFNTIVEEKAKESIHAFHDIKSLIGSILKTSEEWVYDTPGATIDEKIRNAPEQLQTIYHSCEVVQTLLQITDVLVNPKVLTFGKPYECSIHGIFFKLIKVHEKRATDLGISFNLGNSNNSVRVYNSFLLIPQILIDNAIKHSEKNSVIIIKLKDKHNGEIRVDFSTYGILVPPDEETKIFNRRFRGSNARQNGTGLGLYIAQQVAKANGFDISYEAEKKGIIGNKGINHFKFTIPKSAPER